MSQLSVRLLLPLTLGDIFLIAVTRRKKVRCSGSKPKCMLCQHLDQECHYSDGEFNRRKQAEKTSSVGESLMTTFSSAQVSTQMDNAGVTGTSQEEMNLKLSELESQLQRLKDTIQRLVILETQDRARY